MPGFVAAPAYIRSADGDYRTRLQLTDQRIISVPVIFLLLAVTPLPAGSVQPDTEQFPVACQQLS
ncbi:hypothetical protein D3C75_1337500 [compost metagenome]